MKRRCVRHINNEKEGWCVIDTKHVPARDDPEAISCPTLCGHQVTFPGKYETREPDCPDCLAIIKKKESRLVSVVNR